MGDYPYRDRTLRESIWRRETALPTFDACQQKEYHHDVQQAVDVEHNWEDAPNVMQGNTSEQVAQFFQFCLKLVKDLLVAQNLISTIQPCLDKDPQATVLASLLERGVQHMVKKKRTSREFKFRVEIDNYEMDNVILYLGSSVNFFTKEDLGTTRKTQSCLVNNTINIGKPI